MKNFTRLPFRPYVCRQCRLRLLNTRHTRYTLSTVGANQRSIQPNYNEFEAEYKARKVDERIQELGGFDKIHEKFPRLHKDSTIPTISSAVFNSQYKIAYENERGESNVPSEVEVDGPRVTIYGRVTALRQHGSKLSFVELSMPSEQATSSSSAHAMLSFKNLQLDGDELELSVLKEFCKTVRKGDWISITGSPGSTKTEPWAVLATQLPQILSPSLHIIPEAIQDPESRMQNRHVDNLINPSTRDILFTRHIIISSLRNFLTKRNFVEVDTPLLTAGAGGAVARPFETQASEFRDTTLNLRIAPELFLKRLIIGGMEKVFELGPAFRNEGVDLTHNPEFTICEFYSTFTTLPELISMTERLFQDLSTAVTVAQPRLPSIPTPTTPFTSPFQTLDFIPALEAAIRPALPNFVFPSIALEGDNQEAASAIAAALTALQLPHPSPPTLPRLLDALSSALLEPQCTSPTFLVYPPECTSPLAKSFLRTDPATGASHRVAARAELFIEGREYVNCYEEENSPLEQRRKFHAQGGGPAMRDADDQQREVRVDEHYLRALEWGMPPTGGWGCGVDRLVMLFAGRQRIADVLSFGTLRNVVALGKVGRGKDGKEG